MTQFDEPQSYRRNCGGISKQYALAQLQPPTRRSGGAGVYVMSYTKIVEQIAIPIANLTRRASGVLHSRETQTSASEVVKLGNQNDLGRLRDSRYSCRTRANPNVRADYGKIFMWNGRSMAATRPEIALVITTYQKPLHLRKALLSVTLQKEVAGQFEVVVTDDGSTDETAEIVSQFRRSVDFPVHFTTHPHTIYHPARSRNEGAAATTAPYLLFLDGDCILPPNHVKIHLRRKEQNCAMLGFYYRMDQASSEHLTDDIVRSGEYQHWDHRKERRRLFFRDLKIRFNGWRKHPTKHKLAGCDVGIWRADFERINGFDENFQGWGQEDCDLGRRLIRAGVRTKSILRWTNLYHIWHPVDTTKSKRWCDGANIPYYFRRGALTRCRNGLQKRSLADIRVQVVGRPDDQRTAAQFMTRLGHRDHFAPGARLTNGARLAPGEYTGGQRSSCEQHEPEVEVLFSPGTGNFSKQANCRLLVVLEPNPRVAHLALQADMVVSDQAYPTDPHAHIFPLRAFDEALRKVA